MIRWLPRLRVPHGSRGTAPLAHCFHIVKSSARGPRAMRICLVAAVAKHGPGLEIERVAVAGSALRQERGIRLRQRCACIAEAIGDRVAAVAAEILERHLDPGSGLAALVLG